MILHLGTLIFLLTFVMSGSLAAGEEITHSPIQDEPRRGAIKSSTTEEPRAEPASPAWHYGGFIDLGYSLNFNFPENHLFRNRSTTPRVNELDLNMAGVYIKKEVL